MYFEVSKDVFDMLPNAVFGVVAVKNIDNSKVNSEIAEMLSSSIESCQKYFEESGNKAKNDPCVTPYRDAFRLLGINPNRYACSIEALMDRIAKGKGLPMINPAVDLGNAISLKYRIPIGAHDIDSFIDNDGLSRGSEDTGLEVRPACAEDRFRPFGAAEDEFDDPELGEVVYVSGHEVRTRRWTWRQSEAGKMTDATTSVLYPIDGFKDINYDELLAALDEFKKLLPAFFGNEITVSCGIVDATNTRFEF